jgi:hypothetical protein
LTFYALLLRALLAWHVSPEVADTYAHAMADVCASRGECLRLASLAHLESAHFAPWVLDFRCNDAEWRHQQGGWIARSCDSGAAFGAWQIHDPRLLGASPGVQASVALYHMRAHPRVWTTWTAAKSHAAWWDSKL